MAAEEAVDTEADERDVRRARLDQRSQALMENTRNALQQVNAGGFQVVEVFGLVITLRSRHFSSMKLLVVQSAFSECLWCSQTTRAKFAHAGARAVRAFLRMSWISRTFRP